MGSVLQNCNAGADLPRTDAQEALTGSPLPHRVVLYSEGDHAGKEHTKQETLHDTVFGLMNSIRRKGPGGVNLRGDAFL